MAKKTKKARKETKESSSLLHQRIEEFLPLRWDHPMWWGIPSFPDLMAPLPARVPKVDMIDLGAEILVEAELPGADKEGVTISGADNSLLLRAVPGTEDERKGDYYYREIGRGEYQRTLLMPCRIDWPKVEARIENGVLRLRCPKVEVDDKEAAREPIEIR